MPEMKLLCLSLVFLSLIYLEVEFERQFEHTRTNRKSEENETEKSTIAQEQEHASQISQKAKKEGKDSQDEFFS